MSRLRGGRKPAQREGLVDLKLLLRDKSIREGCENARLTLDCWSLIDLLPIKQHDRQDVTMLAVSDIEISGD